MENILLQYIVGTCGMSIDFYYSDRENFANDYIIFRKFQPNFKCFRIDPQLVKQKLQSKDQFWKWPWNSVQYKKKWSPKRLLWSRPIFWISSQNLQEKIKSETLINNDYLLLLKNQNLQSERSPRPTCKSQTTSYR